jgi:hypothetical protein
MKPHKWAKEIKAWADGAEIECLDLTMPTPYWGDCEPMWHLNLEYRIKPQPKEPQYLYVYQCRSDGKYEITNSKIYGYPKTYIGKIKLEAENE